MKERVAIQGTEASFHDIAAREYFGSSIDLVECLTFRHQCKQLVAGEADYALMAIENSLAGSILANYRLLEEFPIAIAGEVYIQIQQHLLSSSQSLFEARSNFGFLSLIFFPKGLGFSVTTWFCPGLVLSQYL